jgi:hypothetical protein
MQVFVTSTEPHQKPEASIAKYQTVQFEKDASSLPEDVVHSTHPHLRLGDQR